ncbi:MAG: tetratricopeptide repeat protein [Colwelliaceae bacterium]|jgi:tetratricopeptide (TPR) repeat protein|nr:tetratricopeptide repeat protein [Colwelliaceae bacterium]
MNKKLVALMISAAISFASHADILNVEKSLENNDILAAEKAFESLSLDEKNSIQGRVFSGRILLGKDQSEEAFDYFEDLRDDNTENVEVNYYLGVSAVIMAQKASIFSKLGYAEDFLEAMEKTIELKPDHKKALNSLIGFHLAAPSIAGGDTDKALTYANQLKSFDEELGYEQVANVYWQTEKPELAEQALREGLKAFPESAELYFSRASSYIKEKAWDKARLDLNLAIKYAKDDESKGRALYQQGKVSAESGMEIDLGIASLIQAIPLADEQYEPWVKYRLAQLYVHNKDFVKAKGFIAKINVDENDDLKSKVKKLKKKLKKLMS